MFASIARRVVVLGNGHLAESVQDNGEGVRCTIIVIAPPKLRGPIGSNILI